MNTWLSKGPFLLTQASNIVKKHPRDERIADTKVGRAHDYVDVVLPRCLVSEIPNELVEAVTRLANPGGAVVVRHEEPLVRSALIVRVGRQVAHHGDLISHIVQAHFAAAVDERLRLWPGVPRR